MSGIRPVLSDESRTDQKGAAWNEPAFFQVTGCVLGPPGSEASTRRKSDEEEE